MKQGYLLLLLVFGLMLKTSSLLGQKENCYRLFVEEGMSLYEDQRFEDAINQLKAARACRDKPKNDQLAELIEKVNNGYQSFLEIERNKALEAQQVAEKANEALTVQLAISEANSLAFLSSLESEKNNHEDALKLAYAAFLKSDTLPIVLRSFGEVVLRAKSIALSSDQPLLGKAVFTPLSDRLITTTGHPDYKLQLWSIEGKLLKTLDGHTAYITAISIHKSGSAILSGSHDHTLKLWSQQGDLRADIKEHSSPVTIARFSPSGDYLVSGDLEGNIFIGDASGKKIAMLRAHSAKINTLKFSSDGTRFITVSADGSGKLWRRSGTIAASFEGHQAPIWAAVFSSDEQSVLTYSADQTIRLWDLSGRQLNSFTSEEMIRSSFWGQDQNEILAVGGSGLIHSWDLAGNPGKTKQAHNLPVNDIAFNTTHDLFITSSKDRSLQVWDLALNVLQTFVHSDEVYGGLFSPTGESILTYAADGSAKLWDRQGNILLNWRPENGQVDRIAFSPDGSRIFLGSDTGESIIALNPIQYLAYLEEHPPASLSDEKKLLYGLK